MMLWEVHFHTSYWDNDPRMPGTDNVDYYFYVVAATYKEAIKKAEPKLAPLREKWKSEEQEITANVLPVENLAVAKRKLKSQMGFGSSPFSEVKLSLEEDQAKWRLEVVLVPDEN